MKINCDKNGQVNLGIGEVFIQILVLLTIIVFSLETIDGFSEKYKTLLNYFELLTVSIFTVEYLTRTAFSKNKKRYVFGFYGIVDLLAILPFFLSMGVDLRVLRSIRFIRMFRIFKLTKYVDAIERIKTSFQIIKEEMILFLFASGVVIYLLGTGIYYFENSAQPDQFGNVFDGIWWAVCTLTTVGYGDAYPVTVGGKIFTVLILMTGLGIVAVPTGLVASALNQTRKNNDSESN